jgi:hypothetical protein
MRTMCAIFGILALEACGSTPPAACAPQPQLQYAIARCGFSIAKTAAGYIRDYFPDLNTECGNAQILGDGIYTNNERNCYFTISDGGTDISFERSSP